MPVIKKSDFSLHPQGMFSAKVTAVTDAESLNPDWLPQFRFDLETEATDEQGNSMTLAHYVTQKLTEQNKLGRLLKAFGFDIRSMANGQEFNTDDLVGCSCRIVVEHQERNDGSTRAKVASVVPADPGSKSLPQQIVAENDDEDDDIPF